MNDEALDFSAILRSGRCLWALLTLFVLAGAFGQSDNVTHEIAGLKDPDYKIRASAARTLGTMKDPRAVAPLVLALRDTEIRTGAILALGEFQDQRAVAALIAALNQSSDMEERVPASSLGRIGALAVDPLVAQLKSGDPDLRKRAVNALGWIEVPRAFDALIPALKDMEPTLRSASCKAAIRAAAGNGCYLLQCDEVVSTDPQTRGGRQRRALEGILSFTLVLRGITHHVSFIEESLCLVSSIVAPALCRHTIECGGYHHEWQWRSR